jgi:hypothetical protein
MSKEIGKSPSAGWRMNLQRYRLGGSIRNGIRSIQRPSAVVMTEEERLEKRKLQIKKENPVDPRIQAEKDLGLPPGSILILNGILILASTREPLVMQDAYAA